MSIYRTLACQKEIDEFSPILLKSGNLALYGLHGIGIRTIASYIGLSAKEHYNVVVEDEFSLNLQELQKKVKEINGNILIIIPTFSDKDEHFKKDFQKFLQDYTGKKIATLIGISVQDYLNLEEVFKYSNKPITSVGIIGPRTKTEMLQIIREFDYLNFTQKQKDLIYKISGGIPTLMKRCCVSYIINKSISVSNLLKDETTLLILSNIAKEYEMLNEEQRFKFGLTDENNLVKSKLLSEYIKYNGDNTNTLVDKLLKHFIKSKGVVISNEKIDSILSEEGTFSLWNRYKVIERVREKLPKKHKLQNIRGKGYKLSNE